MHHPFEEPETVRGARLSPVHPRLRELGAVLGEKFGWERPNWFSSNERDAAPNDAPRGWARHNWSPAIAVEHAATREAAGLFDFTSFGKYELKGPGALRLLQWLTDNEMDKPVGAVTYTQMLNDRGGVESDLTVTRLSQDRFAITTGSAFGVHDLGWIRRHLADDGAVEIQDVTDAFACIGLWGPRARQILEAVTEDDIGNAAFPYLTCRTITIASAPVRAQRLTYVGELGWELYVPADAGLRVWDALWGAGQPHQLRPVGYRAVESLRLEKGYRYWSTDVTPEHTPYEAGLGFCVKLGKGEFQGRAALLRQRAEGARRKLCCLVLADDAAVAVGNEPVIHEGRVIAQVTSGGYGFTVRESIACAYLPAALASVSTGLTIELDGREVPAAVAREPRYDPAHSRIKA